MKKIFSLLTTVILVTSLLAIAFAQPRSRKRNVNVNRGVSRTGGQRGAIGAGGAGTYARNRRGRWVTRNGKRIWVPQGSPAVGNRRGVYEREEEAELKKRSTNANTNRP